VRQRGGVAGADEGARLLPVLRVDPLLVVEGERGVGLSGGVLVQRF
jgi:hypothetical protein